MVPRRWQFPISARKWRGCYNISRGRTWGGTPPRLRGSSSFRPLLGFPLSPPLHPALRGTFRDCEKSLAVIRRLRRIWDPPSSGRRMGSPRGKLFPPPGSARIATTVPRLLRGGYIIILIGAARRDATWRARVRNHDRARSFADAKAPPLFNRSGGAPDSTVIEHVQAFPSGRPHTHTHSHPRFTADRDGPTKVRPRINIPNVGSDGFIIARGVQVANASFGVRIIERDIMSRASCLGEQARRMKRPRFRADSPKPGLRNRDNPLAVFYRNCIILEEKESHFTVAFN